MTGSLLSRRWLGRIAALLLACAAIPVHAQRNGGGHGSSSCPPNQVCTQSVVPGGDTEPPSVTILPATDSVHTVQLAVQVQFTDNVGLNPTRRDIYLNGVSVNGQMTHTGAGNAYTSSGTLTLRVGADTLRATICDTSNLCKTATRVWYLRPWVYGVNVTQDGGWAEIPANTARSQTFTVTNTSETSATFTLTPDCAGTVFASACGVSPSSVTLATGAQATVTASFTSGAAASTGTLRVRATATADAAARDDGWVDYEVTRAPVTPAAVGWVALADPNPGTSIERSLCLTMAVGSGAYECGDLRLAHVLPGVRTMNKARGPVLLYNTAHANPFPLVAANVNLPAGSAAGDSVVAVLRVNGVQRARGSWPGGQWTAGQTRRIAVTYNGATDTTGVYPYTLQVTRWAGGAPARDTTIAASMAVVNRRNGPYRPGWWVAGVEQLFFQPDGSRFWVGGDGSTRLYLAVGTNAWRAEKIDAPDSLSYDAAAGTYTRWVSGGVRVVFDALGRHVQTINRIGQVTSFAYVGSRLQTITAPVRSGTAPAWQFSYDGAGLLYQVSAPPVDGLARTVTLSWNPTALQLTISGPDTTKVVYHHDGGITSRIWGRTDREGKTVLWSYDGGQKLRKLQMPVSGFTPDSAAIVAVYASQESRGLAGVSVDVASAFTQVDGPRADVPDLSTFWLNRFGGPLRIQDATGRVTSVTLGDPNYPALATEVTAPGNLVTRATYDARGNVRSVVRLNPYGDGRNTLTRYAYDNPAWPDFATRVVNPAGDSTVTAYDAAGNRWWTQDGRGDSTRVTFGYDGFNAVASVRSARAALAGEAPMLVGYDPASGNVVSTTTPLGAVSRLRQDAIGRDTASDVPVTALTVARTHVWYDLMDRVRTTVSYGDATEGDLTVNTDYDLEGRTKVVQRSSSQGMTHVVQRSWQYDFAGRATIETQENGTTTQLAYDHAGNVIRSTAPRGAVTTTTYDVLNRPLVRISSPEDYAPGMRTLFAATGQALRVDTFPYPSFASPDGHFNIPADTATFAYDPVTGAMTRADNAAAWVRRTYYPNGQLATDTLHIRTWSQTGAAGEFDAHVYALAYTYDLDGRRATLRHPLTVAPANGSTGTRYDLQQYGYEPGSGALAWVQGVLGTRYDFRYDADQRMSRMLYPGGRWSSMTYDADGRLLRRFDTAPNFNGSAGGHDLHDLTYPSYDLRGKVLKVVDQTVSITMQYSRLGSLTEVKGLGGHPATGNYGTYVVDALGNRMQESRVGTTDPTFYEYDSFGRMYQAHPPTGYAYTFGSVPLYNDQAYDAAGNVEWFTERNYAGGMVDATRSFYDGNQRLVATDRQTCVPDQNGVGVGNIPNYVCRNWGNLNNGNAGSFEWYRYDALGRRVLARTRRDHACTNAACSSTITRTVWDGDQLLYEIRAGGGNTSAFQLEDDNATGSFYGRVAYTHGPGIDQPLEIVRMGFPLSAASTYGLGTWNGPYPVIPYADWHGAMEGATTPTGMQIPCGTSPNLCTPGIWPASNLGAFYEPSAPADQQAWFGSLTSGKTDASGFMYMRNRYYNPQTGTFTQPDPIGVAGGLNVYGFAAGDPVSFSDPYGLCGNKKTEEPCPNKNADGSKPWYEDHNHNTVNENNAAIEQASSATGVDSRLIRSIMYMETTHGYYDALLAIFDRNSSVLPMNVRTGLWGPRLGLTREQMKDPATNVMAGARILQQIISDLPDGASIAQVATRYNNGGAGMVNDYGARVAEIYRAQPWLTPKTEPHMGCMSVGYGCSISTR